MASVAAPATNRPPEAARRWLSTARVKVFADGPDLSQIEKIVEQPHIRGVTTNPTLLRKANVVDYEAFARQLLSVIHDRPVSFEVIADEFDQMERQALKIAGWADNVYVKIPVCNTRGESSAELVHRLSHSGVKVNTTALLTLDQVREMAEALRGGAPAFVSVFAGRVADTGVDPVPMMATAVDILRDQPNTELIWASPRELLNLFQADACGCHVITMTADLLAKLSLVGKDLTAYSAETVGMLYNDAVQAGYELQTPAASSRTP
ncbi:MAG: transaldolase [Chloroflexota bacterium]